MRSVTYRDYDPDWECQIKMPTDYCPWAFGCFPHTTRLKSIFSHPTTARGCTVFFEPNETPLDLKWRMFGIPVRVHPFFWLVSAFMGWSTLNRGIIFLVIWVACVFVSVLVHEMGHVLMGRLF